MKKTAFFLLFCLVFSPPLLAQDAETIANGIIGATFKTLAKTYLAAVNFNKLKADNEKAIEKMDPEKFNKRYTKIYRYAKGLPVKIKSTYAITEGMSKEQAIKDLRKLDKEKMYSLIDSIPDIVIANSFQEYLSDKKIDLSKSNLMEEILKLWEKILKKLQNPPAKK